MKDRRLDCSITGGGVTPIYSGVPIGLDLQGHVKVILSAQMPAMSASNLVWVRNRHAASREWLAKVSPTYAYPILEYPWMCRNVRVLSRLNYQNTFWFYLGTRDEAREYKRWDCNSGFPPFSYIIVDSWQFFPPHLTSSDLYTERYINRSHIGPLDTNTWTSLLL